MEKIFRYWSPWQSGAFQWYQWIDHFPEWRDKCRFLYQGINRQRRLQGYPPIPNDIWTLITWELVREQVDRRRTWVGGDPIRWMSHWLQYSYEQAFSPMRINYHLHAQSDCSDCEMTCFVLKMDLTRYIDRHVDNDLFKYGAITDEGSIFVILPKSLDAFIGVQVSSEQEAAKIELFYNHHHIIGTFTGQAQLGEGAPPLYYHSLVPVLPISVLCYVPLYLKLPAGCTTLNLVYVGYPGRSSEIGSASYKFGNYVMDLSGISYMWTSSQAMNGGRKFVDISTKSDA